MVDLLFMYPGLICSEKVPQALWPWHLERTSVSCLVEGPLARVFVMVDRDHSEKLGTKWHEPVSALFQGMWCTLGCLVKVARFYYKVPLLCN